MFNHQIHAPYLQGFHSESCLRYSIWKFMPHISKFLRVLLKFVPPLSKEFAQLCAFNIISVCSNLCLGSSIFKFVQQISKGFAHMCSLYLQGFFSNSYLKSSILIIVPPICLESCLRSLKVLFQH